MDANQVKKLYSIGDSFMTTDDPDDGIISFCEHYCQKKSFDHVSLARPGATNFAIRLQIEQAIQQQADYAVIGITSSDRFDIMLDLEDSAPFFSLADIFYQGFRARSEKHVGKFSGRIVSDTFINLLERNQQKLLVSDQQLVALQHYIADLHNAALTVQKDYYMVSDGLRKMQSAGIDFVLLPGYMGQHDWSWVKRLWPRDQPSPYHLPYGPSDWEKPPKFTNTHNPAWAHEEFCQTLLQITQDWH